MGGYFIGYEHSASAESAMETRDTPYGRTRTGQSRQKSLVTRSIIKNSIITRGETDGATVNKELQHQIRGREPLFCPSLFK